MAGAADWWNFKPHKFKVELDGVDVTLEVRRGGNFIDVEIQGESDKYCLTIFCHGKVKLAKYETVLKEIKPLEEA